MAVTVRQGFTATRPGLRERGSSSATAEVVALRPPARTTPWTTSAEAAVERALCADAPVAVVLLRAEARSSRLRRRPAPAPSVVDLVRVWRGALAVDEHLVAIDAGTIGVLLPGSGLDAAFERVEALRGLAGPAVAVTAAVAAVRAAEPLEDASRRAARKLAQFSRAGASALAV
ncbi:hypothetical protein [Paraconexibacter algicola]|uniref:Uncharacterized protein n=1 Tax=Paraconexibacter algicola TaxID=2133960 RepID=A0A2T4UGV1_9ACTN|nr:hypothetical protein [Paraconexibacter algicola]PTL58460.1 hypothetical protein C7Y72_01725 [Paraconexibacter algicola]